MLIPSSSLRLGGRGESAAAKSWASDGLGAPGMEPDERSCVDDWITRRGFGPGLRLAEIIFFFGQKVIKN